MLNCEKDTNAEILRKYKNRFYFMVQQILAFDSSPIMVREVKNLSLNFEQIDHDVLHYQTDL